MKTIKVEMTIATAKYENVKPIIENKIPENITPVQ